MFSLLLSPTKNTGWAEILTPYATCTQSVPLMTLQEIILLVFLLLLLVWCARLDRDPAHSAHGFGQQVESLVLRFGVDDWVIDQINREPMRMLMPSPATDHEPYCRHVPINKT